MERLLKKAYDEAIKYADKGKAADYIPELANEDIYKSGISIIDKEGKTFNYGEIEKRFSIQSIAKVVIYLLVLENCEEEEINNTIGVKPTALPFNSILDLELGGGKPRNPMINAGAIASTALLYKRFGEKTFDIIVERMREIVDNKDLQYSEEIFQSESRTAYNNIAITNIMVARGVLPEDIPRYEVAQTYFKACSLMVNVQELAKFSYLLSNNGYDKTKNKEIFSKENARILRTIMAMAGMYDYAGEFAIKVGMPGKSGVGGGIIVASQEGLGIATYCPGLDESGNSLVGMKMLEIVSKELELKIY